MIRVQSLKTQFSFVIAILVVAIISLNAYFFIKTKSEELKSDIYKNAVSFANLTVKPVMDAYYLFFQSKSYVPFISHIKEILKLNNDIARIRLVSYPSKSGQQSQSLVKYDTNIPDSDIESQLDKTTITDPILLEQIRFRYPTFRLAGSDMVYGRTESGFVDLRGNSISSFVGDQEIENVVFPYTDNVFSVIYDVSYANLSRRIQQTTLNVSIFAILAILVGIAVSFLLAHHITDPIKILTRNVLKIAKGDLTQKISLKSHNEIGILAETFNEMTDDLAKYQQDLVEKEKMNQEIQLAAEIQQNLLPKKLPAVSGIDIAAGVHPAVAVGGDVYDFIEMHNGDLLFFIGDVTGHGIPASLIASITNTLIFTLQHASGIPRDIALLANEVLYSKTKKDMFVTMIIARWEKQEERVRYTCAGHDQIIHYHANTKKASLEPKGGVALGLVPDVSGQLEDRIVTLESGDFLLFYSDGIPEALNPELRRFSMERFVQVVEKYGESPSAQEMYDRIIQETQHFMRGYPQADDITLIVVRKK